MPSESADPIMLDEQASRQRAARKWLSAQKLAPLPRMMLLGAAGRLVRADDAPSYFTIFISARPIIALVVVGSRCRDLPAWVLIACFLPLTVLAAMPPLRPVEGATAAASLHLGLRGAP